MENVVELIEIARFSEVDIERAFHFDEQAELDNIDINGKWFNDIKASLLVMPEIGNYQYRIHTRSVDTGEVVVYRKKVKDVDGNIYNVFQDRCLITTNI